MCEALLRQLSRKLSGGASTKHSGRVIRRQSIGYTLEPGRYERIPDKELAPPNFDSKHSFDREWLENNLGPEDEGVCRLHARQ